MQNQTFFGGAQDSSDEETAGADIQRKIRQQPGCFKQTNINMCGYEMC